jgi:hypothetical protein
MSSIKSESDEEMEEIPLDDVVEQAPEAPSPPPARNLNFPFCRKKRVRCGRDLGVWESSLEDRAHCFSRLTLSYLAPLLDLGARKVLDADDIGVPSKQDEADRAFGRALAAWECQTAKTRSRNERLRSAYQAKLEKCATDAEREKIPAPKYGDPSIAVALYSAFGTWRIFLASLCYISSAVLGFLPVMILNDLVKFFESGQSISEYNGYVNLWVEVAALGLIPIIVSLLQTINQTTMAHCAVFTRTAVSTLLYRKALRVSPAGRAMTSTGQVVNMMSNDTAQLQLFLQFLGMILASPVQIVVALILIYQQVRTSASCCYISVIRVSMFGLLPYCSFTTLGWTRYLGRCRIQYWIVTRQRSGHVDRDEATPPSAEVFGRTHQDDERDSLRNSNHQILCVGTSVWQRS